MTPQKILKLPKRKLLIYFKCVQCGRNEIFNWTFGLGGIEVDPKRLIHHQLRKKIHKFNCPKCNINFDVSRVEFFKRLGDRLVILYEENVDKDIYKPAEFYNMKFATNDSGIGAALPIVDNEPQINLIRKRECPVCGHRYSGSPICPRRSSHYKPKKSLSHREPSDEKARIKEFLNSSHLQNTTTERD